MEQIPKLYDRINFTTIPKCILEELNTHSDRKSSISTRDENGKMITTWGDFITPLFTYFHYNALNFYVNQKYLYDLFKWLDLGYCFDSKYNKLNRNNIENFYNEYSKGFNKGYFEFENSLKDKDSIFSTTDEQIAFKIYSQIKQPRFINANGQFKLVNNSFNNKDIEEKICLENDIKFILLITESAFFESGLNGGKFYKAWELILNNSTVFEPLFLKNSIAKETSQQIETKKPDEAKKELHNHIFKDNAFEVWQSMFDEFGINESSRTDVKFMFEEMKKKKLIHHTVNQINFLEWISLTYSLNIEKTSNHSRTKARLQAFSRAIELNKP
jgi:hypothetical protein